MNPRILTTSTALALALCSVTTFAQNSTPPASAIELETLYTTTLEDRAADILKALALTNDAEAASIHDLIIAQYRVMRSRDALIDAQLKAMGKDVNYQNRASQL
jgi:hypothetical protein